MRIAIWSLGIIFSLISQLIPSECTEVISCSVSARTGANTSMTLNLTYNSSEHNGTKIRLIKPLDQYVHFINDCDCISATPLENITNCHYLNIFIYKEFSFVYNQGNATTASIILSEFNFPTEGISFGGSVLGIKVFNFNWSSWFYCPPFDVDEDPVIPLTSKLYIYIYIWSNH